MILWKSTGDMCNWSSKFESTELINEQEDAYIKQLSHFHDVITGSQPPLVSAADATATLRATLAVYESAKSGARVIF